MAVKLGYDAGVKRLNPATVAALVLFLSGASCLAPSASAQINGTPASVTSINSGARLNSTPGVPASITSLGPNGLQPRNPFPNQPACCINPLFPSGGNHPLNPRHHHQHGQFFPAGAAAYVPYGYPVFAEDSDGADATAPDQEGTPREDDERGGPTIFDRRGPGPAAHPYADAYAPRPSRAAAEPVPIAPASEAVIPDQPQTVLVFKDGHQLEVQNYAVIGDMLYDLTPGRHHKIALAELDLTATTRQNEDRGIDFRLPPKLETSK